MALLLNQPAGGVALQLPHDFDPQREARVASRLDILAEVREKTSGRPELARYRSLLRQYLDADKAARATRRRVEELTAERSRLVEEAPPDLVTQVMAIDEQLGALRLRTSAAVDLLKPMLEAAREKASAIVTGIAKAAYYHRRREVEARREALIAEAAAAVGPVLGELLDLQAAVDSAENLAPNFDGLAATVLDADG